MAADPLFHPTTGRFPVPAAGGVSLAAALVSCTGAQFCGLALAETKLPLLDVARRLDAELDLGTRQACGNPGRVGLGAASARACEGHSAGADPSGCRPTQPTPSLPQPQILILALSHQS